MRTTLAAMVLVPLVLVVAPRLAQGQANPNSAVPPPGVPPPPPPALIEPLDPVERDGLTFGFAVGGGSLVPDCDNCTALDGVAFAGYIGVAVLPRLSVVFDLSNVVHPRADGSTLAQTVAVGAVQLLVLPRTWLRAGVGYGNLMTTDDGGHMDMMSEQRGEALLLAAGFELLQSRTFTMDLQGRLVAVHYDHTGMTNVAAFLGFNWF
jgi:hypothetical protein